jgi:Uma2 family endonuclease
MAHIQSAERRQRRPKFTVPDDIPLLYEDDEEGDLGETHRHTTTDEICHYGIETHLAGQPRYRVFSNMNLYYCPKRPKAYVSPDTMVVEPYDDLGEEVTSYRIGKDGPTPLLTVEVLSERSAQQRDKTKKVTVYAMIRVPEYILVDVSGEFLRQRLLLKHLQPDGTYHDTQDADGGVTSQLGFRLLVEGDGQLRVLDAASGKPYPRPNEAGPLGNKASSLAEELRHANQTIENLKTELERLRHGNGQSPTKRRKKP